jgi:hypothetical protein
VATPTGVHPYSEFTTKLQQIGAALQSALGGAATGTTGSAGTATTGASGTATTGSGAAGVSKYSQCIQQAGGDVTKMQKCATLLSGGG